MTKGRWPEKGIGLALPIAEGRGPVWVFEHATDNPFSFMIVENGRLTAVGIQKAKKLRGPVDTIEAEHNDVVAGMYAVPRGGAAAIEIWFYSRRGAFRFFRLEDAGLMEIDLHGMPFVNGKPSAQLLAVVDNGVHPLSRGPVAPGAAGLTVGTGKQPGLAVTGPAGTGPAGSGIDPRSPIIRWLAKRNAARKIAGAKIDAAGSTRPAKNGEAPAMEPEADRKEPAGESVSHGKPVEDPVLPVAQTPLATRKPDPSFVSQGMGDSP